MTGPAPKMPVKVVPEAATAVASLARVSRRWASRRRRSARNSAASPRRAAAAGPDGQMRRSLARGDLPAKTAGYQVAQHGVEPAGDLGAGPAQVPVTPGPYLQHCRVSLGGHRAPGRGAQRGDRDRSGVVGVVLVGVPGRQQPDPGGHLRQHVHHLLPGGHQLLGQQVT